MKSSSGVRRGRFLFQILEFSLRRLQVVKQREHFLILVFHLIEKIEGGLLIQLGEHPAQVFRGKLAGGRGERFYQAQQILFIANDRKNVQFSLLNFKAKLGGFESTQGLTGDGGRRRRQCKIVPEGAMK